MGIFEILSSTYRIKSVKRNDAGSESVYIFQMFAFRFGYCILGGMPMKKIKEPLENQAALENALKIV